MHKEYVTITEAAAIFGVSNSTLRRRARAGSLPAMVRDSGGKAGFTFLVRPADVAKAIAPRAFVPRLIVIRLPIRHHAKALGGKLPGGQFLRCGLRVDRNMRGAY